MAKMRFPWSSCFGHCCLRKTIPHSEDCIYFKYIQLDPAFDTMETRYRRARILSRFLQRSQDFSRQDFALHTISLSVKSRDRQKSLSRNIPNVKDRRKVLRWMIRATFGYDICCSRCGHHRLKERHAQACSGIDVDVELRRGNWRTALELINQCIQSCTPWQVSEISENSRNDEHLSAGTNMANRPWFVGGLLGGPG